MVRSSLRVAGDAFRRTADRAGRHPQTTSALLHGLAFLLFAGWVGAESLPERPEVFQVRFRPAATREATAGREKRSRQTAKKENLRPERSALRAATGREPRVESGRKNAVTAETWKVGTDGRRAKANPELTRLLAVDDAKLAPRAVETVAAAPASDDPAPTGSGRMMNGADDEVQGERRLVNLSDKLDLADDIGAQKKVDALGSGLEIGLLENSGYTLMPEFLWGTPEIAYPDWAQRRGSEGSVLLVLEIRANGEVGLVRAAETPLDPELADVLIKAATTWRFKPMYKDGQPLSGNVSVRVHYILKSGAAPASAAAPSAPATL